jgi:hypothetical protein
MFFLAKEWIFSNLKFLKFSLKTMKKTFLTIFLGVFNIDKNHILK